MNPANNLLDAHPHRDTLNHNTFSKQDESQWSYYSGYRELDQTNQEIRILTLLAGSDDSEISCTIEHELLSDVESFIALSYCWGNAGETAQILLDNEYVCIRRSLWEFLWHLRQLQGTTRAWVDFICINQRNPAERNHQVKLMRDIFSTASSVHAWLGEATTASERAVAYIKQVFLKDEAQMPEPWFWFDRSPEFRWLSDIVGRPFWTRLWIIQEIVLAQNVQIMIGHSTVSWELFKAVCIKRLMNRSSKNIFAPLLNLRPTHGKFSERSFQQLSSEFHQAKCRNPRDKIYGLMGMVPASVREKVVVDYEAPTLKVCLDNIRLLMPTRDLDMDRIFLKVVEIYGGAACCLDELQQLAKDTAFLAELPAGMLFSKMVQVQANTFYTFAAKGRSDSQFSSLTDTNRCSSFDLYLSYATDHTATRGCLVYTTCPLENGDFVLIVLSTALIARRHGTSYRIIDMGASEGYLLQGQAQAQDPDVWLEGKMLDAQIECDLLQSRKAAPSIWLNEAGVQFRLNGSAFAQMLRDWVVPRDKSLYGNPWVVTWDPGCLVDGLGVCGALQYFEGFREGARVEDSKGSSKLYNLGMFIDKLVNFQFKSTVPRVRTGPFSELQAALKDMET